MGKNSNIEWTHHTFNPWWGCAKVSPACKHCYAEAWARRVGSNVWGRNSERRFFSDKYWREPLKWESEARGIGERRRVFCASMADLFEVRADLNLWRERLWDLVEATPSLDWLLLTKRPQQFQRYLPTDLPKNVWLGVTVENQHWATQRLSYLAETDATIRFLSCEPLLGPLNLSAWLRSGAIDWVIAGGESGAKARPIYPGWLQSLRDQCLENGVAFYFKQWGHWTPHAPSIGKRLRKIEVSDWGDISLWGLGKKRAGRLLNGRTWDQLPTIEPARPHQYSFAGMCATPTLQSNVVAFPRASGHRQRDEPR